MENTPSDSDLNHTVVVSYVNCYGDPVSYARGRWSESAKQAAIEEILVRLANGESLVKICNDEHLPDRNYFMDWCDCDDITYRRYLRARELQADYLAEDTVFIADTETDAARARNRISARQWYASKVNRTQYGGDAQTVVNNNQLNVIKDAEAPDQLARKVAFLLEAGRRKAKTIENEIAKPADHEG